MDEILNLIESVSEGFPSYFCIWYNDRYWSKILFSTVPIPGHGLIAQVDGLRNFMLKFNVKVFMI